ncbi:MAG: hypothetical protein GX092_06570, partial [Clostridia bacterium]|nr:hypothetical protein [Clostridia bacterium]
MSKSKLLTVFLLLSMVVTLAVGCSQEELGFLELQKEINELTVSECSAEMVLSLKGLPAPATADPAELILYNLLQKGITVKYNGKADLENETMDYTFSYFNETIGTELEISRFICKDNIMYIKIDTLGDFLKAIGATEASSEFDKIFGDTEYLSMTTDEYLMSMDLPEGFPFASIYQTSFMNNDLNKIVQKLMLGLPGAYQNYTAGLVVKNGNSYTWQMNGMEAVEFFGGFLRYSLENIPDLEKWLVSFINNLSEEEMTLLGMEPQQKAEMQLFLSMFAMELAEDKETYLQAIDEGIAEILKDETVQKIAEGINISYALGKNGPDSYTSNCSFDLTFNENNTQIGLQLTGNAQINKTAPFALTLPTSGIMTYTEFLNKITKTMEIQIDTNSYTLTDANGVSQNYLEVKNIENQTYLPMR